MKITAKHPDGTIRKYTLEQLHQDFLEGKVTTDWLACEDGHVSEDGQMVFKPVTEVLYQPRSDSAYHGTAKAPFLRRKVTFYFGILLIGFWFIWPSIDPVAGDTPLYRWFEERGLDYRTARTLDFLFYWTLILVGIFCVIASFRARKNEGKSDES